MMSIFRWLWPFVRRSEFDVLVEENHKWAKAFNDKLIELHALEQLRISLDLKISGLEDRLAAARFKILHLESKS